MSAAQRPGEPVDDRAMRPPADPWATIDRPAETVYLGGPDTTVHLGPAAPAAHPPQPNPTVFDDEFRFGPGVPAAPPAAPGWPAAAPAKRPRPLWRRLVSILSSLLTLALVVIVGLYLWERLSPLVVESATVAVPRPAGNRCDVTVEVVGTVHTNGKRGTIRYQWLRSNASPSTVLTEQVGSGQRTATITLKWTFNGVGTTAETATLNITEPTPMEAQTAVAYHCRRG
ncbi:hypothetical protein [Actinoplanes subtropicus]|uniref:hypothetical protein n=1 Tax=Actinoplanes subtropicus TaxID=543632 RepID=UPI0004C2CE50|nr:hypothetical protein [Actinoplanes subtropicus]